MKIKKLTLNNFMAFGNAEMNWADNINIICGENSTGKTTLLKVKIFDIPNTRGYEIIAMEADKDHMHFLISYDTTDRVCDIVKIVKQETTYCLWQKYGSFLSKQYWKKRIFWSDGYFACSIGEVSSATIQKYIESQG